jgi:hypothetical protein
MTLAVFFFLPETKGVPVESVPALFARHWFWRRIMREHADEVGPPSRRSPPLHSSCPELLAGPVGQQRLQASRLASQGPAPTSGLLTALPCHFTTCRSSLRTRTPRVPPPWTPSWRLPSRAAREAASGPPHPFHV